MYLSDPGRKRRTKPSVHDTATCVGVLSNAKAPGAYHVCLSTPYDRWTCPYLNVHPFLHVVSAPTAELTKQPIACEGVYVTRTLAFFALSRAGVADTARHIDKGLLTEGSQ